MRGHTIPSDVVPNISQGILFCKYAREHLGVETAQLPQYEHEYPDGRKVWANLYPVELLGHFQKWVNEQWLPTRAEGYFKTRDPVALPHIDQMLQVTAVPKLRHNRVLKEARHRRAFFSRLIIALPLVRCRVMHPDHVVR